MQLTALRAVTDAERCFRTMDDIELTPFQRTVSEMVLDTPAPGKHCARSAMAHIQRAWVIRTVDPEMSAFRAITGEEESATAIFHALQRRRYAGSSGLRLRDHRTKSAVIPFLDAVALTFANLESLNLRPTLEVDTRQAQKRLQVRVTLQASDGEEKWAYPDPPLDFTTAMDGDLDDFSDAIHALATKRGVVSLVKLIEKRANYRNRLLYATAGGVPKIEGPIEPLLLRRRDHIYRNLIIFLLIDQHSEHQRFVQQTLDAFLRLIKRVPRSDNTT